MAKVKRKAEVKLLKEVTLYKTQDKVTVRKPRKDAYISFSVQSTPSTSITKIKQFVKHIITDIKELNYLKNDMGFAMEEIFNEDHSTDTTIDLRKGKIFYIWVFLPFVPEKGAKNTLPKEVQQEIFPYDIFYIRQPLTNSECKNIQYSFKRDIDASIQVRSLGETPEIPFDIKVSRVGY